MEFKAGDQSTGRSMASKVSSSVKRKGNKPSEMKAASSGEKVTGKKNRSIDAELRNFIISIDSLARTLPMMSGVLHLVEVEAARKIGYLFKEGGVPMSAGKFVVTPDTVLPAHLFPSIRKQTKRIEIVKSGKTALSRSYLTSLVSHYDAYIGGLIKALYYIKPELLNASEKSIPFQQLLAFSDLEEARDFLIEKEVETVLRDSHADQFKWLEKKLKLPLTKDLKVWPLFIEVTERRNLFVHTGGAVSSQYLKVCREYQIDFSKEPFTGEPEIGSELLVSRSYFIQAYETIFEIGFKLAHVIWRKLQPNDRAKADQNLSDITYGLIAEKSYGLAIVLLKFALGSLKKFSSDEVRRRLVINLAQAYKWNNQHTESMLVLDAEDWTATSDQFKLAVSVLRDDLSAASKTMLRIGADDEKISKGAYHDWPIFSKFRETPIFSETYRQIFNEEFVKELPDSERDLLETLDVSDGN